MTTPQITIVPLGTVYIVSDKGFISSLLGLGDTPWHIVAPTADDLGDRVKRMEALIEKARVKNNRQPQLTVTETGNGGVSPISINLPAPIKPPFPLTLDGLGLPPAHLWRLKKAGVSEVSALCGLTADDLSALPGVGPAMLNKIVESLATHGLRLTEKVGATS